MSELELALNGPKGELDSWLEVNDEAETRQAILAFVEAKVAEALAKVGGSKEDEILAALARIEESMKKAN